MPVSSGPRTSSFQSLDQSSRRPAPPGDWASGSGWAAVPLTLRRACAGAPRRRHTSRTRVPRALASSSGRLGPCSTATPATSRFRWATPAATQTAVATGLPGLDASSTPSHVRRADSASSVEAREVPASVSAWRPDASPSGWSSPRRPPSFHLPALGRVMARRHDARRSSQDGPRLAIPPRRAFGGRVGFPSPTAGLWRERVGRSDGGCLVA